MMTRGKSLFVLALLVAGLGATLWAMRKDDSQLAKVEALREELFRQPPEQVPPAERREQWAAWRQEIDKLSPEEREQFFASMRARMTQRMQEQMDRFFALSPEQQQAELDKQIDRMQRWEQRAAQRGGDGARRGGPPGFRGRGGDQLDPEKRNEWRRRMLDGTTPKLRAQFTEFRRLMNERRQQRGLPPMRRMGS